MKKLRILALVHPDLVPPERASDEEVDGAPWRTEYHVAHGLVGLGHEVHALGVGAELEPIRRAVREFQPHIAFNLLEGFDDIVQWGQNIVAYLELQRIKYTGCNARGLMLAQDKALAKRLLTYHRIRVAEFAVARRRRVFRRPKRLAFPLIVKSLELDASIGISQASVVENEQRLQDRIQFIHESLGTDALVETYVEGRELYVGVLGNQRLHALPIWELDFADMPEAARRIATERLKWSPRYQAKHNIASGPAEDLGEGQQQRIHRLCKRVYDALYLSGYARIDLRLTPAGEIFVMEANPNPQIASDEEFAESAREGGIEYGALLQRIVNLGLAWEPVTFG